MSKEILNHLNKYLHNFYFLIKKKLYKGFLVSLKAINKFFLLNLVYDFTVIAFRIVNMKVVTYWFFFIAWKFSNKLFNEFFLLNK